MGKFIPFKRGYFANMLVKHNKIIVVDTRPNVINVTAKIDIQTGYFPNRSQNIAKLHLLTDSKNNSIQTVACQPD